MLKKYYDILARVRQDGRWHSIRSLVQPEDPDVLAVAAILSQTEDFIAACQDFVDSFTTYAREVGDYWCTPAETMAPLCPLCYSDQLIAVDVDRDIYRCRCGWIGEPIRAGDCDDKAILLTSLLRYQLSADDVYCAFGVHRLNGHPEGHMWVMLAGNGEDIDIEATAPSEAPVRGRYQLMAFFNDQKAYAYPEGVREFHLKPIGEVLYAET